MTVCSYCSAETFRDGLKNLTFEREGITVVVFDVPAQICARCGEGVVSAEVADQILDEVDAAVAAGITEVRFRVAA